MFQALKNLSERMGIAKERELFDPAVLNDLVAVQTGWHPLQRGGASFRTRKLIQKNPDRVEFRPTFGALMFGGVFGGFGVMGLLMCAAFFSAGGMPWFTALLPLFVGSVFIASSIWMIRRFSTPIVFDGRNGWFWKGREDPMAAVNRNEIKCLAKLEEVHALQLISETCRGKDRSYLSYELNLVLKSGRRVNVFDHGSLKSARSDADKLAAFLGRPVWDAIRR